MIFCFCLLCLSGVTALPRSPGKGQPSCISQGSPKRKKQEYLSIIYILLRDETERERDYEELPCVIMEAEKSLSLLSASWGPRTAGGAIQSESEGPRTQGTSGVSPSLRAGEDRPPSSCSHTGRGMSLPHLCFFFLLRPSVDWMMTICNVGSNLLYEPSSNASLIQKHPHRCTGNNV